VLGGCYISFLSQNVLAAQQPTEERTREEKEHEDTSGRQTAYENNSNNGNSSSINVITFYAGIPGQLGSDKGTPRLFSYPLYIIQRGESITWQNEDTEAHQLKITKESSEPTSVPPSASSSYSSFSTTTTTQGTDKDITKPITIFVSKRIEPESSESFTFNESGLYEVQSITDPSLKGEIVVADEMTTMKSSSNNNNSRLSVELSWYPAIPTANGITYFKIQFLDRQNGKIQPHIDYMFSILNSTGSGMIMTTTTNKSLGAVHSAEGKDFTQMRFASKGTYIAIITVQGIDFTPIPPDQARFKVVVNEPHHR
jgi:plastocyanin